MHLHSHVPPGREEAFVLAAVLPEIKVGDAAAADFDALEGFIQSHVFETYLPAAKVARAFNKRIAGYQERYGLHLHAEKAIVRETVNGWQVGVTYRD